jgi:hypothetical protein
MAEVMSKWISGARTGQMTIVIDFNQGGIRSVDISEKSRLNLK